MAPNFLNLFDYSIRTQDRSLILREIQVAKMYPGHLYQISELNVWKIIHGVGEDLIEKILRLPNVSWSNNKSLSLSEQCIMYSPTSTYLYISQLFARYGK